MIVKHLHKFSMQLVAFFVLGISLFLHACAESGSVANTDIEKLQSTDILTLEALQVGDSDYSGLWVLLSREQLNDSYSRTYVAIDDNDSELVIRQCINKTNGTSLGKTTLNGETTLTLSAGAQFPLESDTAVSLKLEDPRHINFGQLSVQADPDSNSILSYDSTRAVSAWKISDTIPLSLGEITIDGEPEKIVCLYNVEYTNSTHNGSTFSLTSTYGANSFSNAKLDLYTTHELNHADADRTAILRLNDGSTEEFQAYDWGQSYRAFSVMSLAPLVYNGEYYVPEGEIIKEGSFSIDLR